MNSARYFVLVSATLVTCGWALSMMGFLIPWGYMALAPLIFVTLLKLCPSGGSLPAAKWRIRAHSFRTPLPAIFLSISVLSFAGALLHAPNNYDYLTYRLSRLLHWQHEGGWHWITTANDRMNYSGANAEWLMAPLLFFTDSDRFLFLPNIVCFLLLPAATFAVFHGAGVGKRAAWFAMWTIPTAYCYVAQAGGTGNDLLGTGYFLFSIAFALRAKQTGESGWLFLAALAIALCTGVKATNLPLLLPWMLIAIPAVRSCKDVKLSRAFVVAVFCLVVSLAPVVLGAAFNSRSGGIGGGHDEKLRAGSILGGLVGNSLAVTVASLQPPLLPIVAPVNSALATAMPKNVDALLERDFPRLKFKFNELPNEENAGPGLGMTLLAAATIIGAAFFQRTQSSMKSTGWILALGVAAAFVAYMGMAASESAARLLSPYYPVALCVPFAMAGATHLSRRTWWCGLCACCAASALTIPLLTPSRPLVPVSLITDSFPMPGSLRQRVSDVYNVYACRSDNLGRLRSYLPVDAKCIGLIANGDDIEVSLWRPFGSERFVRHVDPLVSLPTDIDALVVSERALSQRHRIDPEAYATKLVASLDWDLIASEDVVSKVQEGPVTWMAFKRTSSSDQPPERQTRNLPASN